MTLPHLTDFYTSVLDQFSSHSDATFLDLSIVSLSLFLVVHGCVVTADQVRRKINDTPNSFVILVNQIFFLAALICKCVFFYIRSPDTH